MIKDIQKYNKDHILEINNIHIDFTKQLQAIYLDSTATPGTPIKFIIYMIRIEDICCYAEPTVFHTKKLGNAKIECLSIIYRRCCERTSDTMTKLNMDIKGSVQIGKK